MLQLIEQKYPAPRPIIRSLIIAILFGIFIGLFLLFFEPFDINLSTSKNKVFETLFFGFITTFVLLIFLYILPSLFPRIFSDDHWKVKHQIIFYLIILFVIATLNGLYTNYIKSFKFSWSNYWWIISRTFALGGIPIAFLTLLDQKRKAKLNSDHALDILSTKKEVAKNSNGKIQQISTDLKNETFSFNENDFIYAIAVGNYIDMCILVENSLKISTYRVTLSSFEAQLDSSILKRCHRSYLVNLKKVKNISGNAQGLKLEFEQFPEIIPVSRKYIPIVKRFF